ncbi:MAG: glycosyltransferase [Acetobacteraceae bacterium]|nr:glycosyltransferase [Acetobacteraceae bacterium]
MRIVVLGLSLSSSWGNGHATTYRALLKALAARGHDTLFLERDKPWYAEHRDLGDPAYCALRFYQRVTDIERWREEIAAADAVVLGSYLPDGVAVIEAVQKMARGVVAFYDIDTPVTLAKLAAGQCDYLSADLVPGFDLYLSFTGGPTLRLLENAYGARVARALYCSVDPELYFPTGAAKRWDCGYIGTYSPDRQPKLERLLLQPARLRPDRRFVVAGPQYPPDIAWPRNVERVEHLPPAAHAEFYSSLRWTLNITRADMVQAGYSPSVRLFEASACETPIISDRWPGLDTILAPGTEIVMASEPAHVFAALDRTEASRSAVAQAARRRVLAEHSAARRAAELEAMIRSVPGRAVSHKAA